MCARLSVSLILFRITCHVTRRRPGSLTFFAFFCSPSLASTGSVTQRASRIVEPHAFIQTPYRSQLNRPLFSLTFSACQSSQDDFPFRFPCQPSKTDVYRADEPSCANDPSLPRSLISILTNSLEQLHSASQHTAQICSCEIQIISVALTIFRSTVSCGPGFCPS